MPYANNHNQKLSIHVASFPAGSNHETINYFQSSFFCFCFLRFLKFGESCKESTGLSALSILYCWLQLASTGLSAPLRTLLLASDKPGIPLFPQQYHKPGDHVAAMVSVGSKGTHVAYLAVISWALSESLTTISQQNMQCAYWTKYCGFPEITFSSL